MRCLKAQLLQEGIAGAVLIHAGGFVVVMPGRPGYAPGQVQGVLLGAGGGQLAAAAELIHQQLRQTCADLLSAAGLVDKDHRQVARCVLMGLARQKDNFLRAVDKAAKLLPFHRGEGGHAGLQESPGKGFL